MSTGKSITTQTNFASKKLLGKAHTSNLKTDVNESIPSNVSVPSKTVFGETSPTIRVSNIRFIVLPLVVQPRLKKFF